jgi:hypothetical protein
MVSSVLPDWMLQIGFGFDSRGFVRDSSPHQTQYELGLARPEEHSSTSQGLLAKFEDQGDIELLQTTQVEHNDPFTAPHDGQLGRIPTYGKLLVNTGRSTQSIQAHISSMTEPVPDITLEEASEQDQPSQQFIRISRPQLSAVPATKLLSDQSGESRETEVPRTQPHHDLHTGMEGSYADAAELDIDESSNVASEPIVDTNDSIDELEKEGGSKEKDKACEDWGERDSELGIEDKMGAKTMGAEDDLLPSHDGSQDVLTAIPTTLSQHTFSLQSEPATRQLSSARNGPIVIDLLDKSDGSSEEEDGSQPVTQTIQRRSDLEAQSAADFELQPSTSIALSQTQRLGSLRLRAQDTFKNMDRLDGSVAETLPLGGSDVSGSGQSEPESPLKHKRASKSPILTQSPILQAYDGAMEFIATSLPMLASQAQEVTYPKLPPLSDFETAQLEFATLQTTGQILQEDDIPATPEASQQLSLQPTSLQQLFKKHHTFPPTPHRTQTTSIQSYSTIEGVETALSPEKSELFRPEMTKIRDTPLAAPLELHSDSAPFILEPWTEKDKHEFKDEAEHKVKSDEIESATQAMETLNKAKHSQRAPQIQDREFLTLGFDKPAVSLLQEHQLPATTDTHSSDHEATQEIVQRDSQLPVISDISFSQSQATQARGLLTGVSYYTPLSNLFRCIRVPSNSQGYNGNCVDVIAIVSKETTKPMRADKGPRDYYTTFSITDEFFSPRSLRVQVFRPWRAALPKAEEGDVVLLRGFEVFSTKGNVGVGLKSGEDAAWCVWHFTDNVGQEANSSLNDGSEVEGKPWMIQERKESLALIQREEMRGPPVELDEEERDFVGSLRSWWKGVERESHRHQANTLGSHGS